MFKIYKRIPQVVAVAVLIMSVVMTAAHADDDNDEDHRGADRGESHNGKYSGEALGKPLQPAQVNAKWKQECSNCHIAYAPGLLPAESWRKVMAGLDKHFGSDASLDAQENKEITGFLVDNASNRWNAPTAPLRITDSAWFKSKHDSHEISPSVWNNPKVKSPANCGACHTKAENGSFNEHDVRMPK